ncbi:hypothetical protein [Aquipuribacter sp. MA13-6]|uniref:hypothetical protein n=1 Tax=unclassified Aquipuribacter TaxID=2635084 RepID=UPI003EEFFD42
MRRLSPPSTRLGRGARVVGALLGVLALGLVPVLPSTPASARHDATGRPVVTVHGSEATNRVVVSEIVPGTSRTVVLALDPRTPVRDVHLAVADVVDDDHGCLRPEVAAGDTTCGPGGGELSAHLTLQLHPGSLVAGQCRPQPVPQVPATPFLDAVHTQLVARARGTGSTCALLTVAHVDSATDNLTQGDTVAFALVVGAGRPAATRSPGPLHGLTQRLPGRGPVDLGGGRP